jgi:hypothetical protein
MMEFTPSLPDLPMWANHPEATNRPVNDICVESFDFKTVNCSITLTGIFYNTTYAFRILVR